MNSQRFVLIAFVLVALAQLYVPAKMIFDREKILREGKEYKFKTAPVDPTDFFRGKYITMSYEENSFKVPATETWDSDENIYVQLTTDKDGFAKILSVSKVYPHHDADYVKAKVNIVEYNSNDLTKIVFEYPFDRFYMEEFKAGDAEEAYRESLRDSAKSTYALVSIKDGEAVLKDVMIDGISIKEY